MANLKVTWVKSAIGYPEDQKRTIRAMGLRRLQQSVELADSGPARGMITKVRHLVKVEIVESAAKSARRTAKPAQEAS